MDNAIYDNALEINFSHDTPEHVEVGISLGPENIESLEDGYNVLGYFTLDQLKAFIAEIEDEKDMIQLPTSEIDPEGLKCFRFTGEVWARTREEADRVLADRFGYDEELTGVGDYTLVLHDEIEED